MSVESKDKGKRRSEGRCLRSGNGDAIVFACIVTNAAPSEDTEEKGDEPPLGPVESCVSCGGFAVMSLVGLPWPDLAGSGGR